MTRSNQKIADDLERRAASNIATADQLVNNGAEHDYAQPLRDSAEEMLKEAAGLRARARKPKLDG